METKTETRKKIGLLGCIGTGIGAIIGSGIFGSLPTVINDIGTGIVLALLATIIYTLAKTIPNVYLSSVATGSRFGVLMTVFSFVNALSDIVLCMVPFFLKKKYPHACNHSTFKMAIGLVYALSAFAFVVAAYLAYAMISTLGTTVWLMIVGAIVLFVIYILIRISYLKKQGRDLIAELKQPYEPWEARERECKKMDEAK